MPILVTERLALRELALGDADFIFKLLNDPAFIRFIGDRNIRSTDDAKHYLRQGPLASYQRHGFGLYLVEEKSNGAPVGMCGLIKRDTLPDVDIGYAFLPEFRSRGYALEAAAAVMNYGKEGLKLKRIVAIVTPDNERSIHLLSKLGLQFERMITWTEDGSELKLYATGS